jgi:hypothetical protein
MYCAYKSIMGRDVVPSGTRMKENGRSAMCNSVDS